MGYSLIIAKATQESGMTEHCSSIGSVRKERWCEGSRPREQCGPEMEKRGEPRESRLKYRVQDTEDFDPTSDAGSRQGVNIQGTCWMAGHKQRQLTGLGAATPGHISRRRCVPVHVSKAICLLLRLTIGDLQMSYQAAVI